jgi:hypothetical protein
MLLTGKEIPWRSAVVVPARVNRHLAAAHFFGLEHTGAALLNGRPAFMAVMTFTVG